MDLNYAILIGLLVLIVIGMLIAMLRTDRDHRPQRAGRHGEMDYEENSWSWGDWDDSDGGDSD